MGDERRKQDAASNSVSRLLIHVACGVLVNHAGEVLIAQRPAGKIAEGYWEFPGGKIEPDESVEAALARELHEELGVTVRAAQPLIRFRHDYSNRSVWLDTWRVTAFDGEPHGRENQAMRWRAPAVLMDGLRALPTVAPIAMALRLPADYVFTPPDIGEAELLRGLERLPRGALLRLRLPRLDERGYLDLALRLSPRCSELGLMLMLDRGPAQVATAGAAGWHATGERLRQLAARPPLPAGALVAASVHDDADMAALRRAGADFAVIGSVRPTATHPGVRLLGWDGYARLAQAAGMPCYAIGGVGPRDRASITTAYGQGAAGISAYWSWPSSAVSSCGDASSAPRV